MSPGKKRGSMKKEAEQDSVKTPGAREVVLILGLLALLGVVHFVDSWGILPSDPSGRVVGFPGEEYEKSWEYFCNDAGAQSFADHLKDHYGCLHGEYCAEAATGQTLPGNNRLFLNCEENTERYSWVQNCKKHFSRIC